MPELLEGRLKTNYVPTDSERDEIENRIRVLQKRSSELREEISSLRNNVASVVQRKHPLQAAIDDHRCLLSRSRALPDSILVMIFLFCIPTTGNATMNIDLPPLLLGRVCRRWRYIAHTTPRLWATLHIPVSYQPIVPFNPSEKERKTSIDALSGYSRKLNLRLIAVQQWLLRTGLTPLSISIHPPYLAFNQTLTHLNLILPYLNRLKNLEVTILSPQMSNFFSKVTYEEVPVLENVNINFLESAFSSQTEMWRDDNLLQARKLRSVQLSCFPFFSRSLLGCWSELTDLEILRQGRPSHPEGMNLFDAYITLASCSNLRRCALEIENFFGNSHDFKPICLAFLESIYVIDKAFLSASLFKILDTPLLKRIQYHSKLDPESRTRSPLLYLLNRSSVPIERLATDLNSLTFSELLECFTLTPSLTHFLCDNRPINVAFAPHRLDVIKSFFKLLIPDGDGKCFWKRLTHICIEDVSTISDLDVLRFIERRTEISNSIGSITYLKSVKIKLNHPARKELQHVFSRRTAMNGIQIELKYPEQINPSNLGGHFNWRYQPLS